MANPPTAPLASPATLPRRLRERTATTRQVNYIRERIHIEGATVAQVHAELKSAFSYNYVYRIAIGERRRNVPYSQRILDWLERTKRPSSAAGL